MGGWLPRGGSSASGGPGLSPLLLPGGRGNGRAPKWPPDHESTGLVLSWLCPHELGNQHRLPGLSTSVSPPAT